MIKTRALGALTGAMLLLAGAVPAAAQDSAAGETAFRKCKACHQIGAEAKNATGPQLNGVIGRKAGTADGFRYGKDLAEAGVRGLVWTEALVAEYAADPEAFLQTYLGDDAARTRMTFKLGDETDRVNIAAYLAADGTAGPAQEASTPAVDPRTDDEVIADQTFDEAFLNDPANIDAGREIWFAQCTHCHGFKAYPGKAPKLKPARYKPEFVFKRVYKGFKKMPPWKDVYSVDEIRAIVTYVKAKEFSP